MRLRSSMDFDRTLAVLDDALAEKKKIHTVAKQKENKPQPQPVWCFPSFLE